MHPQHHLIDLLGVQSLLFIHNYHLPYQVLELLGVLLGLGELYLLLHLLLQVVDRLGVVPGENPVEHFVGHHSETPNVAFDGVLLALENLGGHVVGSPHCCLILGFVLCLGFLHYLGEPEIGYLGMALVDQDVLGLQVPVVDSFSVEVEYAFGDVKQVL